MKLSKLFSWVGPFFQWLDDNILSKTTRLWMYALEVAGVIVIFTVLSEYKTGFSLIIKAKTAVDLQRAQMFIDAVTNSATPLAAMVATICGGIPTVMGVFKSFNKKWKNGSTPAINGSETIPG